MEMIFIGRPMAIVRENTETFTLKKSISVKSIIECGVLMHEM